MPSSRLFLYLCASVGAVLLFFIALPVKGDLGSSLSSDNFRILDPQHGEFGGISSSSSSAFRLVATLGDLAIGSSSTTTFGLRSGFLYFPQIVAPTLSSATAGSSQVALVWLAASAFQGLSVSSYNVCTKPSSGSYTCSDVGSVLTYTKTSLTNGTAYTFKIEAVDALSNVIATSNELSATPTGGATPTTTPGGGGGGGGGGGVVVTIRLQGYAYPAAEVQILRDAQRIGVLTAHNLGTFSFDDTNALSGIQYKYSLYATDDVGRHSSLVSVLITAPTTGVGTFDQIVIPPTIALDNEQLNKEDTLVMRGSSFPGAQSITEILPEGLTPSTLVDAHGNYVIRLLGRQLQVGVHSVHTKTRLVTSLESPYSYALGFGVNVPFKKRQFFIPRCGWLEQPDLNCDGRVNIIDISIMMYYFRRPIAADFPFDFNKDGKIDIIEFSIMVFYWTG